MKNNVIPLSEHSPRPWRVTQLSGNEIAIQAENGTNVIVFDGELTPDAMKKAEDNSRIIVSCVNACEGIDPDAVQGMLEMLKCAVVDSEMILSLSERKNRAEFYRSVIEKAERISKKSVSLKEAFSFSMYLKKRVAGEWTKPVEKYEFSRNFEHVLRLFDYAEDGEMDEDFAKRFSEQSVTAEEIEDQFNKIFTDERIELEFNPK